MKATGIIHAASCAALVCVCPAIEVKAQSLKADPNQDGNCDQFDLVQVLQAGKYLTGEPATWGEGDWNGAPGGSPGNPPPGDRLFDQLDIINFLNDGCPYLTGPYADFDGAAGEFTGVVPEPIAPGGVRGDDQTSIVYNPANGEVAVDAPANVQLTSINVDSAAGIFTGEPVRNLGGSFDNDWDYNIFKAMFGSSFGSLTFGNVAQPGLALDFLLDDLLVVGSLDGGGGLGPIDLVYIHELFAGDADQNLRCDQLDFVQVLQRGKYLTGQPATWGEGDWDGAPGGYPGNPPPGDGLFGQLDIISALGDGCPYLTGPYAAIRPGGIRGDDQTSIIYDARTGKLAIDAPAGRELTAINIDSAAGIFTGEPALGLGGSFDNDSDYNIFRATYGCSFGNCVGNWSAGNVASPGVSEQFLLNDLTVVGALDGGEDLGDVDLIYIPEPSTLTPALFAAIGFGGFWRRPIRG